MIVFRLTARTQDDEEKDWFALSGTAAVEGETYSFRMQDSLFLTTNSGAWHLIIICAIRQRESL